MISSQKEDNGIKLVGSLFGSETRARILKILVLNPQASYNVSEIAKIAGLDAAGIHREISNLTELELVSVKDLRYSINKNHVLFQGLNEIFKKADSLNSTYFMLEEIPNGYPLLTYCFMNIDVANNFLAKRGVEFKISKSLTIYEKNIIKINFIDKDFKELSKEVLSLIIKNPQIGINDTDQVLDLSDKLMKFSDEFNKKDYTKTPLQEMLKLWREYYDRWKHVHVLGWFQNASDMEDMAFTKHLLNLLGDKVKEKGSLINKQDAFSKLTTPTEDSNMQKEYEALLEILIEINKEAKLKEIFTNFEPRNIWKEVQNKEIGKVISKHVYDYGWLGYGYVGPNWDELYFIDLLSSLIRQKINPEKVLEENKEKKEQLIKEQEKIIKSLGLNEYEQKLFYAARGFVFAKGVRKDAMFHFLSRIEPFYQEIARRLFISINDLRYCYPFEFEELINKKPGFIGKLRERQEFAIWESTGKYENDLYLEGKKAKDYLEKLSFKKEESADVSQLAGTTASPVKVRGSVKIINLASDMKKMQKGDILISIATNPDLVPAMKIEGAIVTDVGGITCHAAIVSRELNIPCVVGTKIATKALHEGDLIDVDATHGIVRIIKKA